MNLNTFENTFAGFCPKPWILSKSKPNNNCPGNCQAQINGAFWLNNQRYWVYKCACCDQRQIQSENKVGGGNYA